MKALAIKPIQPKELISKDTKLEWERLGRILKKKRPSKSLTLPVVTHRINTITGQVEA
jgi:hypothetical protein